MIMHFSKGKGFNSLGKPIRYRSASQAGIAYFTLPVKDGLLFCTDYKKGAIDTVSKASAECNNVIFKKYNGVDCAYFNGTDSSIVWRNVLTKDLTKYTLVVKFACTAPSGTWKFLYGVAPQDDRGQGCSMQLHLEYGGQFYFNYRGSDYSVFNFQNNGVSANDGTFNVGILSVDNGLVKCYLNNNLVYNGQLSTGVVPSSSLLYVGGDYGQSNRLWFEGYIAQSILYDRALNEEEVKALSEV